MNNLIHPVYARTCLYVTIGIVNKTKHRRYGQFKMSPIFIKCDHRERKRNIGKAQWESEKIIALNITRCYFIKYGDFVAMLYMMFHPGHYNSFKTSTSGEFEFQTLGDP